MMRIKVLSVGKTKERWLEEGCQMYSARLAGRASIECIWLKEEAALEEAILKEPHVAALDVGGSVMTSEQFSQFLFKELERGGARFTFAIGPDRGFSKRVKEAIPLISLSPLTFTHQMTRLILFEQIFRAFEIRKGSPYHK